MLIQASLEHICLQHVWHPSVQSASSNPLAGHACTFTAQLYGQLQPLSASPEDRYAGPATCPAPMTVPPWHVSQEALERLVAASKRLDLQDDEITPAQAYQYLKEQKSFDQMAQDRLDRLKVELARAVKCYEWDSRLHPS